MMQVRINDRNDVFRLAFLKPVGITGSAKDREVNQKIWAAQAALDPHERGI